MKVSIVHKFSLKTISLILITSACSICKAKKKILWKNGGVCFQIHSGISFMAVWHSGKEIWYHTSEAESSKVRLFPCTSFYSYTALDDYNHLINDEFHWIWRMVSPYSGAISLSEINRIKKEETGDFDGVLHHLTQTLLLHPKGEPKSV